MTAVANAAFTAAQFNASVRDNLLQTGPALVTGAGQILVSTAANALAARTPTTAATGVVNTTASTTYTDLATVGPVVGPITTGAKALVMVSCYLQNNTAGVFSIMSCTISGATTDAASDATGLQHQTGSTTATIRATAAHLYDTMTPGSNTFTAKYRVSGGTGTFGSRYVTVIPMS